MCFDNDYDWYASHVEDKTLPAVQSVRCFECGCTIEVGQTVRHVYMQEDEICRHDPDSDHYEGEETEEDEKTESTGCPEECHHDYGNTFECDICETCNQLLEGIKQHELEEGCSESESQPAYGELGEAMTNGDGKAYLAKAEQLYPGISARIPDHWIRKNDEDD